MNSMALKLGKLAKFMLPHVEKIKNLHKDFEQNFKGETKNKFKSCVKYPDSYQHKNYYFVFIVFNNSSVDPYFILQSIRNRCS